MEMQAIALKILRWVLIFGTIFRFVCAVLIIVYGQEVSEELVKQYNFFTFIRSGAIFKWDRHMGQRELKENIVKMSVTFLLVVGILDSKLKN